MAGAKVTIAAIDMGIQSCKNMSNIISKDLSNLISEVNQLSQYQQDPNFTAFKNAMSPKQENLENLSKALSVLASFCENEGRPLIVEYIRIQDEL